MVAEKRVYEGGQECVMRMILNNIDLLTGRRIGLCRRVVAFVIARQTLETRRPNITDKVPNTVPQLVRF